jgi:hypothetical protein
MLGRWVGDKLILLNSLKNVYIAFFIITKPEAIIV